MKKIIMGADPLGYELKEAVKAHLLTQHFEVVDVTPDAGGDYFAVGEQVGQRIATGEFTRGFVFCGTGMGVNIVANKFAGVYSALCESIETARLARVINNANVLAMGGIVLTPYLAKRMADVFLTTEFSTGFSEADPAFLRGAYQDVQATEARIMQFNHAD
ncbi:RpiB/LacA/LacB family sugar-phosphate isomerase [Lactiplantibacillus carotarum]|uniref:RpiB/LacA/LacB family sugar-phosphate isomerase n=1 Tax=Lactiplantibacillus carotarum TaxID=2993456 RepID=UPI00298F2FC3|nr:RpiB/LacA/LacB family sugar-phosphate isomerase [Lactiplantibacillus carotarum]